MSMSSVRKPVSEQQELVPAGDLVIDRRGSIMGGNIRAAFNALRLNGMRSFLTLLGIIIGIAAVITATTITAGVGAGVTQRFVGLGTNVLTISPGAPVGGVFLGGSLLTIDDAAAVAGLPHVSAISPVMNSNGQVVYGGQNWRPHLLGVYPTYQGIQNWQLAEGTWFSASDELSAQPAVVVGSTTAENLFGPTGSDPIGKTIRINGQVFRVVGTLQAKGINLDDSIFLPFSTYQQRLDTSVALNQIQVQADTVQNVPQIQQAITNLLESRHHILSPANDDFRVNSVVQRIQAAQSETALLTALFVGIAAISLTIGGIGIMNIMLVSVTERTREIGIRMALGARRSDIRNQFLLEVLTLGMLGGCAGVLLGLLIGTQLVSALGVPLVVNPLVVVLAVGVAGLTGVVFGLYPALRASRLDPIVALRSH